MPIASPALLNERRRKAPPAFRKSVRLQVRGYLQSMMKSGQYQPESWGSLRQTYERIFLCVANRMIAAAQ